MGAVYQALYRKYRPQTFRDVVGQTAITGALAAQIERGRVGHAYLFTGTRGTGKTSCAKLFAKAVNCENRSGAEPCGTCVMCLGTDDGSVLDVAEIDAASNNGVDDVRELRGETIFRPSRGAYRVYIIDEVHMLSTSAFNALLKILEEPPGHVIFILATTEVHKVPATILSRCQRFDFMRIRAEDIAGRLEQVAGKEGIELTGEAADLIARLADGSMRDALSLLDTCAGVDGVVDEARVRRMAGVVEKSTLFEVGEAVATGDVSALMETLAKLHTGSTDARRLCEELVFHYRNLMLAEAKADGSLLVSVPEAEKARYVEAASVKRGPVAVDAVRRMVTALDRMARAPEPRVELELALIDLAVPPVAAAPAPAPRPVATPLQAKTVAPRETTDGNVSARPAPAPPPEQPPASAEKNAKGTADAPESEGLRRFEQWAEVLQRMETTDQMLASFMKGSGAYLSGRHILIEGGALFLDYMRKNEYAREKIKDVIAQVCGTRYAIGPYEAKAEDRPEKPTMEQTLKDWEAKGVPIVYE